MRPTALLAALPIVAATVCASVRADEGEAPAPAPAAAPSHESKVTLVSAGAEPRAPLRYAPSVGDLQTIVVTTASSMGNQMGQLSMPTMKLPTVATTLTMRVDEVNNGVITATARIDDATIADSTDVEPMIVSQFKPTLKEMVGKQAKLEMTDRGLGQSLSFGESARSDPTAAMTLGVFESTINMLSTPLPEEPVGVGASWTYQSQIAEQSFDATETVTYTLESLADGVARVHVKVKLSAEPQNAVLSGSGGATARIVSLSLDGTGEATIGTAHLLPSSADLTSSKVVESEMTPIGAKESQHFKQSVDSQVTVATKGSDNPER